MGNADDGSSDPRDKSANARLIGFLLGKAALCEWMPENFHWDWEYEQYDKYFGAGVFCSVGIKSPIYTMTNAGNVNIQQLSSIILPFAQPPQLVEFFFRLINQGEIAFLSPYLPLKSKNDVNKEML
jgi:hypothetical protein